MTGFLDEFVKLTVNEIIGTNYPHMCHPVLHRAKVVEEIMKGGALHVTLRLLRKSGKTDKAFPAVSYTRVEQILKKGDIVTVGLLYG